MNLEIKNLEKKDYKKAANFAGIGMHFEKYFTNKKLLNVYSKSFLYEELNRASQVIAGYFGNELAGVLFANIKGENRNFGSFWTRFYFKTFYFIENIFAPGSEDSYQKANQEMFAEFKNNLDNKTDDKNSKIDGELTFFAVNPKICGKGIGSALLLELEKREKGKRIFLYTDDACSYQFYEKRGFLRECERTIDLESFGKKTELKCFLYSKIL